MSGTDSGWELAGSLLRVLLALAITVPLAVWTTRWYASQALGRRGRTPLRTLGALHLGPRQRVVVVDVAGRVLVIGTAEHALTLLAELTAEEAERLRLEAAPAAGEPVLPGWLRERLERWSRNRPSDSSPRG